MSAHAEAADYAVADDAAEPLVSMRGVTKTYRRGSMAVDVLHGVSLDIRPGEFVALMGASGSGKSTLMNLIGLLDRPSRYAGREITGLDADERACLRRDAFGFVFQQFNLLGNATATANVEMPAIYSGMARRDRLARARDLLGRLGLADRTDHRPGQLSGGQQQRVAIARALMNGGAMILADEPTGALDSRSGAEVMALLGELNAEGYTILLVTHDPAVAAQASRVIELRDGRIVADTGNAPPPQPSPTRGGRSDCTSQEALPPRGGVAGGPLLLTRHIARAASPWTSWKRRGLPWRRCATI